MPVAVFDLDHTLIRCDSFAAFNRHLIERRLWRVGLALFASPLVILLLGSRRTRLLAGSILVWCGTVGLSEADYERLMDEHVAARFGRETDLVCREAVEKLLGHQRTGTRVLVVTGCVAGLAERICRQLGVMGVEVVGSSLRRGWGGWIASRHCFGAAKVVMLAERGVHDRWDWVYTDSSFDLPLLRHGHQRFLVNPTPGDRRRVIAEFGSAITVVDWG